MKTWWLGLRQMSAPIADKFRVFQSPASILNPIGAPLCIFLDAVPSQNPHKWKAQIKTTKLIPQTSQK